MERFIQLDDHIKTHDTTKIMANGPQSHDGNLRGEVFIRDNFGHLILHKKNIILYGGSRFALEKLFNIPETNYNKITLNQILGVNVNSGITPDDGPNKYKMVCLFGVGMGGAGLTFGDVIPPNGRETNLFKIIPIRYVDIDDDLSPLDLDKYFMRKVIGDKVAYYLKAFEIEPELIKLNADGTTYVPTEADNLAPTTGETGNYITKEAVETYVKLSLKINEEDCREYFIEGDGINMARINEIALFFGLRSDEPTDATTGHRDYFQVEPFTKLTFNAEPLSDLSKTLLIEYRIYA